MAPRSAPLVLRQAGRLAGSLSLRDQALAVCTVLVGAGRYPPPPPLSPLLLRQPATAKLSTRTSRTAVTMYRIRRMAHLLVPVCLLYVGEPAVPQTIPYTSVRQETPCAPAPRRAAWSCHRTLRRASGIRPMIIAWSSLGDCAGLCQTWPHRVVQ